MALSPTPSSSGLTGTSLRTYFWTAGPVRVTLPPQGAGPAHAMGSTSVPRIARAALLEGKASLQVGMLLPLCCRGEKRLDPASGNCFPKVSVIQRGNAPLPRSRSGSLAACGRPEQERSPRAGWVQSPQKAAGGSGLCPPGSPPSTSSQRCCSRAFSLHLRQDGLLREPLCRGLVRALPPPSRLRRGLRSQAGKGQLPDACPRHSSARGRQVTCGRDKGALQPAQRLRTAASSAYGPHAFRSAAPAGWGS